VAFLCVLCVLCGKIAVAELYVEKMRHRAHVQWMFLCDLCGEIAVAVECF